MGTAASVDCSLRSRWGWGSSLCHQQRDLILSSAAAKPRRVSKDACCWYSQWLSKLRRGSEFA